MNDISDLGRRISAAFDTIEAEVADLSPPGAAAEIEQLRAALEAERAAKAELEQSITAHTSEQEGRVAALEAELVEARRESESVQESRGRLEELEAALATARGALTAKEAEASGLAFELDQMREALAAQTTVTQQLNRTHGELRAAIRALREAQVTGATDADLINQSMAAELDALRAARDSDRAEMDELLASMQPFLGETQNA